MYVETMQGAHIHTCRHRQYVDAHAYTHVCGDKSKYPVSLWTGLHVMFHSTLVVHEMCSRLGICPCAFVDVRVVAEVKNPQEGRVSDDVNCFELQEFS